jgi:hypothetical protein
LTPLVFVGVVAEVLGVGKVQNAWAVVIVLVIVGNLEVVKQTRHWIEGVMYIVIVVVANNQMTAGQWMRCSLFQKIQTCHW